MTPRCKIKMSISVLVFVLFIIVGNNCQNIKSSKKLNNNNNNDFLTINQNTFYNYLSKWNTSTDDSKNIESNYVKHLNADKYDGDDRESEFEDSQLYNNDINEFYGQSISNTVFQSTDNATLVLNSFSKCLYDFHFMTCLKMLLLSRVNNLIFEIQKANLTSTDFKLLNGFVTFKIKNSTEEELQEEDETDEPEEKYLSIDQELTERVLELFKNRALQLNILPGLGIEISPKSGKTSKDFVCFTTRTFMEPNFNPTAALSEMRRAADRTDDKNKGSKKKKGGFNMMPFMIVPQMVMLGFLPFALANLKMMVMNAFMVNSMALNGAIFMTIRNLIFGPRGGPKVKYVNYGYSKQQKKSKRPSIVLHSPAAFFPDAQKQQTKDTYSYPPKSAEELSYTHQSGYSHEADGFGDYDNSQPAEDYSQVEEFADINGRPVQHHPVVHRIHIRRKTGTSEEVKRKIKVNRKNSRVPAKVFEKIPKEVQKLVDQFTILGNRGSNPLGPNWGKETKSDTEENHSLSEEFPEFHGTDKKVTPWSPHFPILPSTEAPLFNPEPSYTFDIHKLMTRPNYYDTIRGSFNGLDPQENIDRSYTVENKPSQQYSAFSDLNFNDRIPEHTTKNVFSAKYNKDLIDFDKYSTLNRPELVKPKNHKPNYFR